MLNKGERFAKLERARSQSQLEETERDLGTGVKGTDKARPNPSYFDWSSLGKKSQSFGLVDVSESQGHLETPPRAGALGRGVSRWFI